MAKLLDISRGRWGFTFEIVETILRKYDYTVYIVRDDDEPEMTFAAIVYHDDDGDIITSRDWHGSCRHHTAENILPDLSDPEKAHVWYRPADGAPCTIWQGMPQAVG